MQTMSFFLKSCILESRVIFLAHTLDIKPNKWVCITGQSGIGKTTLLRCLAGLINGFCPLHDSLSYMPQSSPLLPWKTVVQNIQLKDTLCGQSVRYCDDIIEWVGLTEFKNFYPHHLSFGMQKRVLLAQILYNDSDFVLLDEPFSGLDPYTRQDLYALCKNVFHYKTVLHVTHDQEDVKALANEIWHMSGYPASVEMRQV